MSNEPIIYRDIQGFKDHYRISNMGDIFSVKRNKVLSPFKNNKKYHTIYLYKGSQRTRYKVHYLVAKHFHEPGEGYEVNHKDFNKDNNAANNLEWCTRSYNMKYNSNKKTKI